MINETEAETILDIVRREQANIQLGPPSLRRLSHFINQSVSSTEQICEELGLHINVGAPGLGGFGSHPLKGDYTVEDLDCYDCFS